MQYIYEPKGVCSSKMIFEIEGDIVKDIKIIGGCAGNTLGISNLIKGLKIDEIIKKLKGVPCGFRGTSCPDQLATALEEYKKQIKK